MDIIRALEQVPALFYTFVIIFSLLVGSFLNVVIHRLPIILLRNWKRDCLEFLTEKYPDVVNKEKTSTTPIEKYNLVVPRSACPHCGHKITSLENIPVISYLFLRGRCRGCGSKISLRYPLVEALSAILVLVVGIEYGVTYHALFAAILTWVLLSLTFIDFDTQYLPDQITLPFLWLGILINSFHTFTDLNSSVLGAIVGYMSLWTIYQLFKLLTKKEGMGFGDFKLLAMLGAWLGWQMLPAIILISSVIGAVAGILMIITRYVEKGKPIPFGPYLAGAGWIAMIWGKDLNELYLGLFVAA